MLRRLMTGMVLYSIPTLAFAQSESAPNPVQSFLLALFIAAVAGAVAVVWVQVGLLAKLPDPLPTARELLEPNLAWAFVGALLASRAWSGWQFHGIMDFVVAVAGGIVLLELGRLVGHVRFTGVPDWKTR